MTRIVPRVTYPTGFSLQPRVPYKPGSVLRYNAAPSFPTQAPPKKNLLRRIFDMVFKKTPEEVCDDDFVTLKHSKFLGLKENGYNIYHGSKKVGYVDYDIRRGWLGQTDSYPASWYEERASVDFFGRKCMKPFMRINEFSINDRLGKSKLVPRDKKYGTMAMKELLRAADEEGCEGRISLLAGFLGGTKFAPGKFYNKMGFSMSPSRISALEAMEKRYNSSLQKLIDGGLSEEQAKAVLKKQKITCPEKVNGRYVEDHGYMVLTDPDCIRNYPV